MKGASTRTRITRWAALKIHRCLAMHLEFLISYRQLHAHASHVDHDLRFVERLSLGH